MRHLHLRARTDTAVVPDIFIMPAERGRSETSRASVTADGQFSCRSWSVATHGRAVALASACMWRHEKMSSKHPFYRVLYPTWAHLYAEAAKTLPALAGRAESVETLARAALRGAR